MLDRIGNICFGICLVVCLGIGGYMLYVEVTTKTISNAEIEVEVLAVDKDSDVRMIGKTLIPRTSYYMTIKAVDIESDKVQELKVTRKEFKNFNVGDKAIVTRVVLETAKGDRYYEYTNLRKQRGN